MFARTSAQEWPPPSVPRCPRPRSCAPSPLSLGWRRRYPSRLRPPTPLSTEPSRPGLAPAAPSSHIFEAPLWKGSVPGGGREGGAGEREPSACHPDQGSDPAPGSVCPSYSLHPRALPRGQRGAREPGRQCPRPLRVLAGLEVPLLQTLFLPGSPLWCTVQSGILTSAPSSHDPSSTGGAREQSGTCGCRERKQDSSVFPASSPPLCPAPPPFPAQGRWTRRFWKVSLKASGGGRVRIELSVCGSREREPPGKRVGSPGCEWSSVLAHHTEALPGPRSVGSASRRCVCWTRLSSSRGRGEWRKEEEVKGQDSGGWGRHCEQWLTRGARVDAGRGSPVSSTSSKGGIPSRPRPACCFPTGGGPGRRGAGSQVCGAGKEPPSSQPRPALAGAASVLYRSRQPHQPFALVLERKVACLANAVVRPSHRGTDLCFC